MAVSYTHLRAHGPLQSGALLGNGEEADLGGADDMEAAQIRAAGGEGGEAVVDDLEGEHVVLAEAPIRERV